MTLLGIGFVGNFLPLTLTVLVISRLGPTSFILLSYLIPVSTYCVAFAISMGEFYWSDPLAAGLVLFTIFLFESQRFRTKIYAYFLKSLSLTRPLLGSLKSD